MVHWSSRCNLCVLLSAFKRASALCSCVSAVSHHLSSPPAFLTWSPVRFPAPSIPHTWCCPTCSVPICRCQFQFPLSKFLPPPPPFAWFDSEEQYWHNKNAIYIGLTMKRKIHTTHLRNNHMVMAVSLSLPSLYFCLHSNIVSVVFVVLCIPCLWQPKSLKCNPSPILFASAWSIGNWIGPYFSLTSSPSWALSVQSQ